MFGFATFEAFAWNLGPLFGMMLPPPDLPLGDFFFPLAIEKV
jgi:hypothetical protein